MRLSFSSNLRPPLKLSTAALLTLCFISFGAKAAQSADWPTYQRNNSRTGSTLEETLKTPLTKLWGYQAPAAPVMGNTGPDGRNMEGKDLKPRITFDDVLHVAVVGGPGLFWFFRRSSNALP